jgi:benzaldehyde dehydrogenase (NAD)
MRRLINTSSRRQTMTFFDNDLWDGRLYSNGWVKGHGPVQDVIEPATGASIAHYSEADLSDLERATTIASEAQKSWANVSPDERSAIMRRAGVALEAHTDEYITWIMRETGGGGGKAHFEAGLVAGEFYFASATALMPYGQVLRSGKPRLSMSQRIPVGTVGVISPFNFPGVLSVRSVAPALALGNAVILKPDPRTTVTGGLFLAAILEEAGLPDGIFQVLPGGAEIGRGLVEAPSIRVISFTGSTAAGRAIGELAGKLLKRVHLELGGNNAMIVLGDVDVPLAVSAGAWGSFLHQGQICMTTGRHLVHASIYDEYVERLSKTANGLPVGDPMKGAPLGPIINTSQRDKVHNIVTSTVAAGATLSAGGTYDSLFYRPTVLSDVKPDHSAFTEEIFGPVAPVLRFDSIDEAVDIVNQSGYGLSLAILSKDAFAGYELAQRIPSGIVHVNDQTIDDESVAPFGGIGFSGTGSRFGGHEANIEVFTETRWITVQGEIEHYPF